MSNTAPAPFEWVPHKIVEIDCFTKERTGFIGRAVAVSQAGMEFVILAKNEEQLDLVTQNFLGFEIDKERVYKATMIATDGVDIEDLPVPVVPEVPVVPVVPDTPVAVPGVGAVEDDDEL